MQPTAPANDGQSQPTKKKKKKKKKPAQTKSAEAQTEPEETEPVDPSLAIPFGVSGPPPLTIEVVPPTEEPPPVEAPSPSEAPAPAEPPPPETVAAEPAAAVQAAPSTPGDSQSSTLEGVIPILAGLLALAAILLGLAAVPPRSGPLAVASFLAARRLELGLIGAAFLASAGIGLVIALVSP